MLARRAGAIAAGALGVLVVAAAAWQGTARFAGPRWRAQIAPPAPPKTVGAFSPPPSLAPAPSGRAAPFVLDPIVIAGFVLLALAVIAAALVWRWLRTRPAPTAPVEIGAVAVDPASGTAPDDARAAPAVRRGLARAWEALREHRDASDAIVAAWLGLQEAAAESGITRRDTETAAEFTTRIVQRAGADAGAATTLLWLYQDVRFGGRPAGAAEVARARAALDVLAQAWAAPQAAASPAPGSGRA